MQTLITRGFFSLLILGILLSAFSGCARNRKLLIPDLPTAEDQFMFALDRRTQLKRKSIERKDLKKEFTAVIKAYDQVVKRFPDDTRHTPMARLAIGTLYLNIDEPKTALEQFETVLGQFPDDAELQAVALTGKAEALIMMSRYDEARLTLLKCIETYENEQSDSIKSNVVRCRRHLSRIQFM